MRKLEKQLSRKVNFGPFLNLIALTLHQNIARGLSVIKNVNEIKFEGVWCKLDTKKKFSRDNQLQNI